MRNPAFLFLIGVSLSTCGGAQEEPPAAAPEQQAKECKPETLDDKMFAELEREEAKQGGGDIATLLAQMEKFGLALQEAADRIPTPPKSLPDFPAIWVELTTHTSKRTAELRDGKCVADLDTEEHRHNGSYMCFPGWACAAALFQMGFTELATDDRSDTTSSLAARIYQRYFHNGLSDVAPMGDFVTRETDQRIAQALSLVFADEGKTKAFMEWVLKWAPKHLASHAGLLERVLKELWTASSVTPAAGETPEQQYANVHGDDLGNIFRALKRSGDDGRRRVIYLRYWIVQMAHALSMNDVYTWGGDVNTELRNSGLAYEQMYRASLKAMMD